MCVSVTRILSAFIGMAFRTFSFAPFAWCAAEAAACYHNSINLYCQIKRFSTAARLETEVAELMEKDRCAYEYSDSNPLLDDLFLVGGCNKDTRTKYEMD